MMTMLVRWCVGAYVDDNVDDVNADDGDDADDGNGDEVEMQVDDLGRGHTLSVAPVVAYLPNP